MTRTLVLLAAGLILASAAAAEPIDAFDATITTGTTGNGKGRQTLRNFVLGLDFRVDNLGGITVNQLGIWDDVSGNGLSSSHTLLLYDLADTSAPLTQVSTLPGQGDLRDGYRYFDVAPIFLGVGTEFSVVVYFPPDNLDSNGNSGPTPPSLGEPTPIFNGGQLIANIGDGRYGVGLGFPGFLDTGPANRYHAGSFNYSPHPEPGTMLLLGGALTAAGIVRRRRRARSAA